MKVSGLLLAGGHSSRMGEDKRLIEIDGKVQIAHAYEKLQATCDEVLVLIADPSDNDLLSQHLPPGTKRVIDQHPHEGPMGALISGMDVMSYDTALLLAVDLPRMSTKFLERLIRFSEEHRESDIIAPVYADRLQITTAIYKQTALKALKRSFEQGERAIHRWAKTARSERVEPKCWSSWGSEEVFFNLNDMGDLERLADCH